MKQDEQKYLRGMIASVVFVVVMSGLSSFTYSDSVIRVALHYRDAVDVKTVIEPLLPKGAAISIDNNTLLIRAADEDAKALVRVIKAMDKPRDSVMVSVFRGRFPDKPGVRLLSTKAKVNRVNHMRIEDGQTVVIAENQLLKIPVANTQFIKKTAVLDQPNMANNTVSTVVNDDQLETVMVTNDETESAAIEGSDTVLGEVLSQQQYRLQAVPTGVHVRISIVDQQRVRIALKIVSAINDTVHPARHDEAIPLSVSHSLTTLSVIPMNTWTKISEDQSFTHRAVLNASRKVYSTQTHHDAEHSLWLKIQRVGKGAQ
jgi:hypothetical protein